MEDVKELLKLMSKKLTEIESRLNLLESGKVILEERKIPSDLGEFEGKTYFQTVNGGIVKEIRVGICDLCGRKDENFNICVQCERKLCKNCSILFQNQILCKECLNNVLPLSKQEFKVILAITYGVKNIDELMRLTRIKHDEIKACIRSLTEKELIKNSSFLFFLDLEILDKGLEALSAYKQVYGKDEDVISLESEVIKKDENF